MAEVTRDTLKNMDIERLPFDMDHSTQIAETQSTVVMLLGEGRKVVKISKLEVPVSSVESAISSVSQLRDQEKKPEPIYSPRTRKAILPQFYVLANGQKKGAQVFTEGQRLQDLGWKGILKLGKEQRETFKSILKDSVRCYLKYGHSLDILGCGKGEVIGCPKPASLKRRLSLLGWEIRVIFS